MNGAVVRCRPSPGATAESTIPLVFIRSIDLNVDAAELARCRALLDDEERARADRFRVADPARRFTVARAFLRRTLGEVLGRAPESIVIETAERGKPFVRGVEFNLSHSHELAVIAVGEQRVGIDVEHVRPRHDLFGIARRFFAPEEVEALAALPDDEREHGFYRVWTGKEAYLKGLGEGITLPLDWFVISIGRDTPRLLRARHDDAERWALSRVDVGAGYVCTLAIEQV